MAGLADEPVGLRGAAHIPGGGRQWVQRGGAEQFHQFGQHLLDTRLAGFQEVECPIAHPGMCLVDRLCVADVGLAHFDETTTVDQ